MAFWLGGGSNNSGFVSFSLLLIVGFWLFKRICSCLVPSSVSAAKCRVFSGIFWFFGDAFGEVGKGWFFFFKSSKFLGCFILWSSRFSLLLLYSAPPSCQDMCFIIFIFFSSIVRMPFEDWLSLLICHAVPALWSLVTSPRIHVGFSHLRSLTLSGGDFRSTLILH